MSVDHDDIIDVLCACAATAKLSGKSCFVRATQRSGRTVEGAIPGDYYGSIIGANNVPIEMPEHRVRYSLIEVVDANGTMLEKLAPARSASTERGMLAAMLEGAKEERRLQAHTHPAWRMALKSAQRKANEERGNQPQAATDAQVRQVLASEGINKATRTCVLLSWLTR